MAQKSQNESKKSERTRSGAWSPEWQPEEIRHATERTIPMTLLRALAHKQPVCYFNFHRTSQPLPTMGSLGLELSMSPAAAEFSPGAGTLPKETSMGLRGLAEWLDRWTDFEWEKLGYGTRRSGKRLPRCSSAGEGESLFMGRFC